MALGLTITRPCPFYRDLTILLGGKLNILLTNFYRNLSLE